VANPFPPGQCTWWCYDQLAYIRQYGVTGNAKDWLASAIAKGLPTGSTARAGSCMVLQPGVEGASGFGHVAKVTSTGPTFWVTQMDVPVGNPNPSSGIFHQGNGVGFIYPPAPPPAPIGGSDKDMNGANYGIAWQSKRPTANGNPRSDGEAHWFDGLNVWRAYENNGVLADGPHDLGVPDGTDQVLGVSGCHTTGNGFTGDNASWTEIRAMVHNPGGIQFFRKAAQWSGPVDGGWTRIG
jgi:CHAP domain